MCLRDCVSSRATYRLRLLMPFRVKRRRHVLLYVYLGIAPAYSYFQLHPRRQACRIARQESTAGLLGVGPYPASESRASPYFTNAGKETITAMFGASSFSSSDDSFWHVSFEKRTCGYRLPCTLARTSCLDVLLLGIRTWRYRNSRQVFAPDMATKHSLEVSLSLPLPLPTSSLAVAAVVGVTRALVPAPSW